MPPVAYLASLLGLVGGGLVVPVLEVLVNSSLLSSLILLKHGSHTTASLGRIAVHGLVEVGIALVVLRLESCLGLHCREVSGGLGRLRDRETERGKGRV